MRSLTLVKSCISIKFSLIISISTDTLLAVANFQTNCLKTLYVIKVGEFLRQKVSLLALGLRFSLFELDSIRIFLDLKI